MILASDVSARIATLIARHDRGDRRAAAHRLRIDPHRLAGLLSGDWRRFSLDTLAAVVVGYGVSTSWLLSAAEGTTDQAGGLASEERTGGHRGALAQALPCVRARRDPV